MAKERFRRTDYSIDSNVTFLSKFDFDQAVRRGAQRDSDRYRLVRDYENSIDRNAIFIFNDDLCIGYLPKEVVKKLAPLMDAGDVFSVIHRYSARGEHYDANYDNKYNDGYFRDLRISIYNESEIAKAKGKELDPKFTTKAEEPRVPRSNTPKTTNAAPANTGGCLVFLIASATLLSLMLIILH